MTEVFWSVYLSPITEYIAMVIASICSLVMIFIECLFIKHLIKRDLFEYMEKH